jgi:hypothetical protein
MTRHNRAQREAVERLGKRGRGEGRNEQNKTRLKGEPSRVAVLIGLHRPGTEPRPAGKQITVPVPESVGCVFPRSPVPLYSPRLSTSPHRSQSKSLDGREFFCRLILLLAVRGAAVGLPCSHPASTTAGSHVLHCERAFILNSVHIDKKPRPRHASGCA